MANGCVRSIGITVADQKKLFDFEFTSTNVHNLWLLPPTNEVLVPHVIDICTYLSSLFVKECKKENGQWRLTVESTQQFHVDHLNKGPGIFCRGTPKPQRAMDVIPIILRTDNRRASTKQL